METSNPEGIRQRLGKAGTPIASATAKLHRDGDIQTDHPGGDAHHPFIQGVRIVGLALYFLVACLRYEPNDAEKMVLTNRAQHTRYSMARYVAIPIRQGLVLLVDGLD